MIPSNTLSVMSITLTMCCKIHYMLLNNLRNTLSNNLACATHAGMGRPAFDPVNNTSCNVPGRGNLSSGKHRSFTHHLQLVHSLRRSATLGQVR